jgi:hypothetical protein
MTDDLTALRHMAEENARIAQETGVGSGSIAFEPQAVLALLDRLERAEAERDEARESRDGWAANAMEYATAQQAIERVRAVADEWSRDEDAKSLHFDLLAALDTGKETGNG